MFIKIVSFRQLSFKFWPNCLPNGQKKTFSGAGWEEAKAMA
jgi:hypothetical protein